MKGFRIIGRKERQPVARGIKNCRNSGLFKVCSPLKLLCNWTGNRPQSTIIHTVNITKHKKYDEKTYFY